MALLPILGTAYEQTLTAEIAHGGCVKSVREAALNVDSRSGRSGRGGGWGGGWGGGHGGELGGHGGLTKVRQYCVWLFGPTQLLPDHRNKLERSSFRQKINQQKQQLNYKIINNNNNNKIK